jgi:hypothetical protein
MCLHAYSQKANGDKTPKRRIAYKVVQKNSRKALVFSSTKYPNGSEHSVSRRRVMNYRSGGKRYHQGFHVITDFTTAKSKYEEGTEFQTIIAVEVTPARWVADGHGSIGGARPNEAVYTGLKVLGRVTKPYVTKRAGS